MRQLALFLLIVICFYGCGEEETSAPTVVEDTTPPTIIGTNVQGGPISVDTPIVLVFSERVDITSAQSGISVRSSIDVEPVDVIPPKVVSSIPAEGQSAESTVA